MRRRLLFVGLNPDNAVWVPTVFTKHRDRLLTGNIAEAFLQEVLKVAHSRGLLSHEHFMVDGMWLEVWASQKSVRQKDNPAPPPSDGDPKNPTINSHALGAVECHAALGHGSRCAARPRECGLSDGPGARRQRGTRQSAWARGRADVRSPEYEAERGAAVELLTSLEPHAGTRTVGADKGYDTAAFVAGARATRVTPHVAQSVHARRKKSASDASHNAARRVCREPGETEAGLGRVRLGQDDRRAAETASPGA